MLNNYAWVGHLGLNEQVVSHPSFTIASLLNPGIHTFPPNCSIAMRNEFSGQLHKFMARLTDAQHKVVGHTVLYVPDEGTAMEAKDAHTDKDLVQRLEGYCSLNAHVQIACVCTTMPLLNTVAYTLV